METITDIRPQRRKEDRLNVYLDGAYAFSLHMSLAGQLHIGQEITLEECDSLRFQGAVYDAYERALRYLSYRPRSQKEVEIYLGRKEIEPEVVERAIAKLSDAGFVDDRAFAEFWVTNREDFRPRSIWALQQELRQKGVSGSIIDQAVQEIDEQDSAYRAAASRGHRLAHLDYETFRRRLGGFLQRRGFNYGVIKTVVEKVWEEYASDRDEGLA